MLLELTQDLELSSTQKHQLDTHGLISAIRAFQIEIDRLTRLLGERKAMTPANEVLAETLEKLQNPKEAYLCAGKLGDTRYTIFSAIDMAMNLAPFSRSGSDLAKASFSKVKAIYSVCEIKARELVNRRNKQVEIVGLRLADLRENLRRHFVSIGVPGLGKGRVILGTAGASVRDYLVDIKFSGINPHELSMPVIFKEVMIELISNAISYSKPGLITRVNVHQSKNFFQLQVRDQGMGIDETDMTGVVDFGFRSQEAADIKTFGNGIGLTKAYHFVKVLGGRIWLSSQKGLGTEVTLAVPLNGMKVPEVHLLTWQEETLDKAV